MDYIKEEDFYKDDGYPTEHFKYCYYPVAIYEGTSEYGIDYDEFALVDNALYPYIRLTRKRGQCQSPCAHSSEIAPCSSFAKKTDVGRDEECPKIAWGIAAEFLACLRYDKNQEDYVPKIELKVLIERYYKRYWEIYKQNHSGLKYSKVSIREKELNFLEEHMEIERILWKKSDLLRNYSVLYEYASSIVKDYMSFLLGRKQSLEKCSNVTIGTMVAHNEAYFADIEKRIIEALDKAEATINVCVAWFTNPQLRDKLIEKKRDGVDVKVIIYKDGVNHRKGVDLSQLTHKEYRGERGGIMHEKFCVIDNVTTISGSYNWTLNAENKNDEDALFRFEDYKFASKYTRRFNEMWNRDGV